MDEENKSKENKKFYCEEEAEKFIKKIQNKYSFSKDGENGNSKAVKEENGEEDEENIDENYLPSKDEALSGSLNVIQTTLSSSSRPSPLIYELIQNADDTEATNFLILLKEGYNEEENNQIFFLHNGNLFNKEQVSSICSIGQSTKRPENDTIGYFGIGFKSVFLASKNVEIKSGPLNFYFKREGRKGNMDRKWMIVPKLKTDINQDDLYPLESLKNEINAIDEMKKTTIFKLYDIKDNNFKDCRRPLLKDEEDDRWSLKSRSLLFLNNIKNIEIYELNFDDDKKWTKKREIKKANFDDFEKDELGKKNRKTYKEIKKACENENLTVSLQNISEGNRSEKWIGFRKNFELEENEIKDTIRSIIEQNEKKDSVEKEKIEKLVEDQYRNYLEETNRHNRKKVTERYVEIYIQLENGKFSKANGTMASAFYSGSETNQFDSGLNYNISADFLFNTSREKINENSIWNKIMCYKIAQTLKEVTVSLANIYKDIVGDYEDFKENFIDPKKYDLLPSFLAVIERSRKKEFDGFPKKKNFFFENITEVYRKKIKEEKVVPAFNHDSGLIEMSRPEDTIYFWPNKGRFGKGKKDIPRYFNKKDNNLVKEVENFISLDDIKLLINNFKNNEKKYRKFLKLCDKVIDSEDISNDYWEILTKKSFIPSEFTKKYVNFSFKIEHGRTEDNFPLFRLSNNLIKNNLDIVALIHDGEFISQKKWKLDDKDFSKWLIKLYSYLNDLNICSKYENEDEESLRNCLRIFFDESRELSRIAGCNIKQYKDFCPYDCDSYNKDTLYKPLKSIKDLIKNIGELEDIRFLDEEMFKKFRKYKEEDKNYNNPALEADLRYYFECYESFLDNLNLSIAPRKRILENLDNKYSNNQNEIDLDKNITHLKILYMIKSEKGFNSNQERMIENMPFKLYDENENDLKDPKNLLYTEDYGINSNTDNKRVKKCCTINKYINRGLIKKDELDIFERNSFISQEYLNEKENKNDKLIQFLNSEEINLGKGIDNLSTSDKGEIGEKLALRYYRDNINSDKYKVKHTNKIIDNFEGYDIAVIEKEKINQNRDKMDDEKLIREYGHKKIEVKFSTKSEEKAVQMSYGEADLFDKVRNKKEINDEDNLERPEDGIFELFIIYNGLDVDKSKSKIFDAGNIKRFDSYKNTSIKINFNEEFADEKEREMQTSEIIDN